MTDLEISKALALAIGWTEDRTGKDKMPDPDIIHVGPFGNELEHIECWDKPSHTWRVFDYRDEVIAFRVAQRYDCFPINRGSVWNSRFMWRGCGVCADTPQKSIALAVINGSKK